MKQKIYNYCLFSLIAALTLPVNADSSYDSNFTLSGYGTIAYTFDNQDDLAFVRELTAPAEYGQVNNPKMKTEPLLTDSRIGIQGLYQIEPNLEIMGLLNIRHQEETSLNNSLDWLYLGYHFSNDIALRIGRIGYDAFLMSDHRHLGYAYSWVRPPTEFYAALPVYSLDGLDISYKIFQDDNVNWKVKGQLGQSQTTFPFGLSEQYEFESTAWAVSLTRETQNLRIRAGYSEIDIDTNPSVLEPLYDGLSQLSVAGVPGLSDEASQLLHDTTYKNGKFKYSTIGFAYDNQTWLLQGELGYMDTTADVISNGTTAYLNLGRRFGSWTPFVSYSRIKPLNNKKEAENDWNLLTGNAFGDLNTSVRDQALSVLSATRIDQSTISLGVRWDFYSQAALKLQWDKTKVNADGYGLWWSTLDESKDTSIDVFALTMEFIF